MSGCFHISVKWFLLLLPTLWFILSFPWFFLLLWDLLHLLMVLNLLFMVPPSFSHGYCSRHKGLGAASPSDLVSRLN
jgi:hypothetical protein